ncbi:MAG: hypothetical protein CVV41_06655 [Candidatus Riflebacteria bacterium HGW-Riflebacteria-1]|jgi:hypothetical protein|nr:MAG: hypothetical protein CVV41_06655 [Candidatus Riflebacteria bacterium HGW-Riflebacteria-1]
MMAKQIRAEDIIGTGDMPDGFSGGSCGNLAAGTIDGSKIACSGLRADRLSAAMLGGEDMKIIAGTIDARDLSGELKR